MSVYFFSKGKGGRENQDAIGHLVINDKVVVAVADGMGGAAGGAVASNEVIRYIFEELKKTDNVDYPNLIDGARSGLVSLSEKDGALQEMGTTLTLCEINGDICYFFHVGDSRVYHVRGGGLMTRTKDQSELQYLLDKKVIKKSQAANYSRRNILLSVLSPSHDYELEMGEFSLESGDRLLLITDGVYNILAKKELVELSLASEDPKVLSEAIALKIESEGAKDDYSCVIYQHP
ncbi:PP2C family protein-serine/threonine phosphatase [Gilvimarinus japonicus]|uniref:PP2C family protein-serine/threonine phosphatase n=1 Tax=Gilvimarinus japonicus TaxID=1796469 RepID=A0ABV7HLE9_9GAMM